ncbi:hypothetical protein T484DRAFT_1938285 [Baffinella frigidus]|nr:hypothetical protein T484DRAFT_1938285 [Cryptophyta sp. CCMP2293]
MPKEPSKTIPKKPSKVGAKGKPKPLKSGKGDPRHGPPRPKTATAPSNVFLQQELIRLKKANPAMPHKEAFRTAAANWSALKKTEAPAAEK